MTAGGQDGDLRPFGAAEVAAMSAATSPGTGLAYAPAAGLRFQITRTWRHRPGRARATAIATSGLPERVLRLMRRERSALARSLQSRRWRQSPSRCDHHVTPREPRCGTPMAFDRSRWTTAWASILTAVEHWKAECVGPGMSATLGSTASPPCSAISMGLAGLYGSTAAGSSSVAGLEDGSTAPSSCRTTSPTRSSSGASRRPTPDRSRAPDQRSRRAVHFAR